MPAQLKEVLYTAEAVVEGGRKGHGRTSDGLSQFCSARAVFLGRPDRVVSFSLREV